jgi:hypothetical protein
MRFVTGTAWTAALAGGDDHAEAPSQRLLLGILAA